MSPCRLDEGEIVSLIGPNGAGKTTLFNCITGTMPPNRGSVRFRDEEMVGRPPHEVARRGISRTFQHIRVFGQMSVLENVMVGRDFKGRTGIFSALLRPPRVGREEADNREHCLEVIVAFRGAAACRGLNQPARELSYANRRRLEIARALALRPQAPPARRAHGRHEPARDPAGGGPHPPHPRPRPQRPGHRAQDERWS